MQEIIDQLDIDMLIRLTTNYKNAGGDAEKQIQLLKMLKNIKEESK